MVQPPDIIHLYLHLHSNFYIIERLSLNLELAYKHWLFPSCPRNTVWHFEVEFEKLLKLEISLLKDRLLYRLNYRYPSRPNLPCENSHFPRLLLSLNLCPFSAWNLHGKTYECFSYLRKDPYQLLSHLKYS